MREQHGKSKSAEYKVWIGIKTRCLNPHCWIYRYYGGRGIKICERWMLFSNFLADMGPRPKGMSIERIDGDKDYEPSNCKWASLEEQANNRRNNKLVKIHAQTKTLAQWSRATGLSEKVLNRRLKKGYTDDAMLLPTRRFMVEIGVETRSLAEWSRLSGLSYYTLRVRLLNGITGKDLLRPARGTRRRLKNNELIPIGSESKALKEWSQCTGIKYGTLWKRWKDGARGSDLIKPVR